MPVIQKTKYECFSRIVISSEVEKSSLQNDNRRMRESRNMPFWGITPYILAAKPPPSFLITILIFLPLAIFSQIRYSKYIAHYMIHGTEQARIYYEQYRTTPDG